jgi:NAD(P)H-hydrate epimerase
MAGAAVLSTKAALRSGVGLAKVTVPKSIYPIITSSANEAVCNVYDETFAPKTVAEKALIGARAVVIGCGLGVNEFSENLVKAVLESYKGKLIIDADGLNAICSDIECIKRSGADIILTPHPAEMARLCGVTVEKIENDRIGYAKNLSENLDCTVVLKGNITVVAGNGKVYFNTNGNAGMAKGGSGDVLAGIMGGIACTFDDAVDIAVSSVYIHGAAGDMASEKFSEISSLPTDIIDCLPEVYKTLGEI